MKKIFFSDKNLDFGDWEWLLGMTCRTDSCEEVFGFIRSQLLSLETNKQPQDIWFHIWKLLSALEFLAIQGSRLAHEYVQKQNYLRDDGVLFRLEQEGLMGKKGTVQGVEMFQYIHSRATSLIQNVCNVQKYAENIQLGASFVQAPGLLFLRRVSNKGANGGYNDAYEEESEVESSPNSSSEAQIRSGGLSHTDIVIGIMRKIVNCGHTRPCEGQFERLCALMEEGLSPDEVDAMMGVILTTLCHKGYEDAAPPEDNWTALFQALTCLETLLHKGSEAVKGLLPSYEPILAHLTHYAEAQAPPFGLLPSYEAIRYKAQVVLNGLKETQASEAHLARLDCLRATSNQSLRKNSVGKSPLMNVPSMPSRWTEFEKMNLVPSTTGNGSPVYVNPLSADIHPKSRTSHSRSPSLTPSEEDAVGNVVQLKSIHSCMTSR